MEFYVLNTDVQALAPRRRRTSCRSAPRSPTAWARDRIPTVGRQAALEDTERIIEMLEGADMVFVTAGLGGGTGTGAAPVVASLAKELGALTVAVVTKPFGFEGPRRMSRPTKGWPSWRRRVDTVIAIPNDRLLELVPRGTSFFEAFRVADDVLRQAVQGISDIITTPGLINRDFSDIRAIMLGMGYAMMGTAMATRRECGRRSGRQGHQLPAAGRGGVRGARGVLINITGSSQLGLHEVNEACSLIREAAANEDVQINFGVVLNESMGDEVKITVIATGFQPEQVPAPERREMPMQFSAPPPPPEPELPLEPAIEEEPAPEPLLVSEPDPAVFDPEDLDVPAYLRQRRLLN